MIFAVLSPFILGTNLGIDLTGGIQIEYRTDTGDRDSVREFAKQKAEELKKTTVIKNEGVINDIVAYNISGTNRFVVEAGFSTDKKYTDSEIEGAKAAFTKSLSDILGKQTDTKATQLNYVNIGASFGDYIKSSGMKSLFWAIVFISLYIMYAFRGSIAHMSSWPFAVVTGVSLVHDVIIAFGLYMIASYFFPEFKIDTFFLTAMLTILGYSINDTIVVMDRIRSNLHETGKKDSLSHIIDKSINDTMRRSILTSSTVFIVIVCMFLFGPESLKGFMLALLFGTIVGTYSSVCLASPLLIDITKRK
ncbi:protein translocase subunit SecF [Candidatus Gracilibacteria bacterium]|nr:protein translocase subunit SecF [Candidatus Gracilibacteria bacterium]